MKIWDVNVDNIVISKLVKTKTNSKYLIAHLDKDIRLLVLIMPKMSGYVKTFKVKEKSNKLMSFHIADDKLSQNYKTFWTKIKDLKHIELNALPAYHDRYIKTKIRTYDDKFYANYCASNVPKYDIECDSFTVISFDSLLVYENNYYLQVYLDNCTYKIVNKQMTNYLDQNLFEA